MVNIMEERVVETFYYIPCDVKNGGNFYHEFAGYGDNLPRDLSNYLQLEIDIKDVPAYLLENHGITIEPIGGAIPKNGTTIKPFIAYDSRQTKYISKKDLMKLALVEVKTYYNYLCAAQVDDYNYEMTKKIL